MWFEENSREENTIKSLQDILLCPDQSELSVYGNLGATQGQVITVDLLKCTPDTEVECKSGHEIKTFFASYFKALCRTRFALTLKIMGRVHYSRNFS